MKPAYRIEISLRDAKKAQDLIKDRKGYINYKMLASNYYDFKTAEDYDNAIEALEEQNIEIL